MISQSLLYFYQIFLIFNEYYQGIEKETKDIHKYFEEVKEISNRRGFNIYVFYYN